MNKKDAGDWGIGCFVLFFLVGEEQHVLNMSCSEGPFLTSWSNGREGQFLLEQIRSIKATF